MPRVKSFNYFVPYPDIIYALVRIEVQIISCFLPLLGRGGASIYGKQFDDEIHDDLKHTGLCSTLFNDEDNSNVFVI